MANPHRPLADRFNDKVDRRGPSECWPWKATRCEPGGYGRIVHQGRELLAHRVAWELAAGARLDPEITIDHLCGNKGCVNPAHLEPVPRGENSRRYALARTACCRGHPFTPENTRWASKTGRVPYRACRTCEKERTQRRAAERIAQRAARRAA